MFMFCGIGCHAEYVMIIVDDDGKKSVLEEQNYTVNQSTLNNLETWISLKITSGVILSGTHSSRIKARPLLFTKSLF